MPRICRKSSPPRTATLPRCGAWLHACRPASSSCKTPPRSRRRRSPQNEQRLSGNHLSVVAGPAGPHRALARWGAPDPANPCNAAASGKFAWVRGLSARMTSQGFPPLPNSLTCKQNFVLTGGYRFMGPRLCISILSSETGQEACHEAHRLRSALRVDDGRRRDRDPRHRASGCDHHHPGWFGGYPVLLWAALSVSGPDIWRDRVRVGAQTAGADLRRAELRGAELRGAELRAVCRGRLCRAGASIRARIGVLLG